MLKRINNYAICVVFPVIFFSSVAVARQIHKRPTLPSDCGPGETWVRDHSKSTGHWTSFCRVISGTPSKAYKFWASKFKSGRPEDWPFLEERTIDWQSKDIADVLHALEKIPIQLWDSDLNGIYRMNKSKNHPNPGADRDGDIVLYDPAFQNERYTERILAHELAHEKFKSFTNYQRIEYAHSTGWKIIKTKTGEEVFKAPQCCFVKPGLKNSIDEDFATNIEYFLYQPDALKKINPTVYRWIEQHFDPSFKPRGTK